MQEPSKPRLSWHRGNWEERLRFSSAKFTDVNPYCATMLGVLATIGFYAIIIGLGVVHIESAAMDRFTSRGWIPIAISLFFFTSMAFLLLKNSKVRLQRKPLTLAIIPIKAGTRLTPENVQGMIDRVDAIADSPLRFILLNRIYTSLKAFRNLRDATEAIQALEVQAEQDESQLEASYTIVQGIIWAIPLLGFIGTVLGLAEAMQGFGSTLTISNDLNAVKDALTSVVAGLSTAFDTTLLGLLGALFLQLYATIIKKREYNLLDECGTYCREHLVNRFAVDETDQ